MYNNRMNERTDGLMQFHNNFSLFISRAFEITNQGREEMLIQAQPLLIFFSEKENKRFDNGRGMKERGKGENKIKMKERSIIRRDWSIEQNKSKFTIAALVHELWKGAGLKCRGGANHDQLKYVCVCFYKVWICYMNPFRSYVSFCYRPRPLPRLFLSVCPNTSSAALSLMTSLSTKPWASLWIYLDAFFW